MSSDNVVEFPQEPQENKENEIELPQETKDALEDAGWMAASFLIMEIGSQVFGNNAIVQATPDPEGFFQDMAGKTTGRPGVFVTVSSMRVPGLEASLVMPYETDALLEIRPVMQEMSVKLRNAEEQKLNPQPNLLVPEKKLIIPGQE